jgi:hypothetical protein
MSGPGIFKKTGVFYITTVTQQSASVFTLSGKYEDYTGFSTATDVSTEWSVWPNVYYGGYPIAGVYAKYNVTSRTVLTTGSDNLRITVAWDTSQNDIPDNYFPIAATTCVLTSGTPNFNMAIPTPYRDASANGVRLAYDALPAILNADKLNIIDKKWGATGPTGPVGESAFSTGV